MLSLEPIPGKPGVYNAVLNGAAVVVAYRKVEWNSGEEGAYGTCVAFGPKQIRAAKALATKMDVEFFAVVELWAKGELVGSFALSREQWDRERQGTELCVSKDFRRVLQANAEYAGFQAEIVTAPEEVAA
jgi:hypothetical protein